MTLKKTFSYPKSLTAITPKGLYQTSSSLFMVLRAVSSFLYLIYGIYTSLQDPFCEQKSSQTSESCNVFLLTGLRIYAGEYKAQDIMPDRREGITRAVGFVFACIDTQTSK